MANGKIQQYADMVTLQIASEAFLDGAVTDSLIETALGIGNKGNSKLPEIVREEFTAAIGVSQRFKVIAHREMTLKTDHPGQADKESGFSGTLFYDIDRDDYVFSIRSTEFHPEIHDAGDIYADLEIAQHGWAFGQTFDMEGFWSYLRGDQVLSGESGITTLDITLLNNFRGHMNDGGKINVTGFSLGGNLAQAFTELHATEVQSTYLFNAAGTGRSDTGLASIWTQFLATFNDPDSALPYFAPTPLTALTSAIATGSFGNYSQLPQHAHFLDNRYLHAVDAISDATVGAVFSGSQRVDANSDAITDIWASNSSDEAWFETLVADTGVRHGRAQPVWYEDQPIAYWEGIGSDKQVAAWGTGHSIVLLQDSLSLMALFEMMQPDITIAELGAIFELGSHQQYDSLEKILNSLAQIVGVAPLEGTQIQAADIDFADLDYRDAFHDKLHEVRGSSLFTALTDPKNAVDVNIGITNTADIATLARTDFSAFLSLYHLSPFTLVVEDYADLFTSHADNTALLTAWQEDLQLTAGQEAQGAQNFSDQFLEDRAFMLATMMPMSDRNSEHGFISAPTQFNDLSLDLAFDGDSSGHPPYPGDVTPQPPQYYDPYRSRIVFGTDQADDLANAGQPLASGNNDFFYGLAGDDVIDGLAGDDHIEGGAGNDELRGGEGMDTVRGGAGNDRITGGKGDDYLYGGDGADTFFWQAGDGMDTIADYDDGGDRLVVDDIDLATLTISQVSPTSNHYRDANHPELTMHFDGTRLLVQTGTGADAGQIRLEQYNLASGGDFGIVLNSYAAPSLAQTNVTVTQLGKAASDVDSEAWWRQQFSQGQLDWSSSTIGFDAAAVSNYSGTTGNPVLRGIAFQGGPQDDQLTGDNLNNTLFGLSGADSIHGNDGFDLLEGWRGSDTIHGGAGPDIIYGNTAITRAQGLNAGINSQAFLLSHIGDEPDDVNTLDGGADQDLVIGGEYRDIISGGAGDDYLWGGTGNDHINGGDGTDSILGDSSMVYVFALQDGAVTALAHTAFAEGTDGVNRYDDVISGGAGNDYLWGELGNDQLHGDDGDDYLYGDRADSNRFTVSPYLSYEDTDADLSHFLHGNDSLYGGAGDDVLVGQGGDDLLSGGAGNDGLWGGPGDDAYVIGHGDGFSEVFDNEGQHTLVFEGFQPDSIDVSFQGSHAYVGSGEDRLRMARGEWENTSIALNARENLIERSQLDTYYLDAVGNLLMQVQGQRGITEADRDRIAAVDDSNPEQPTIVVGQQAHNFDADASTQDAGISVSGSRFAPAVAITLANGSDGFDFSDIDLSLAPEVTISLVNLGGDFEGTANADHVIGDDTDNEFSGGGADDRLEGRDGSDALHGQSGNDTLMGGNGNDSLDGGPGDDTLLGGAGNDELRVSLGSDRLVGGTGDDVMGSRTGYSYGFSAGDGNDVIEVDNAGGGYSKGTIEFAADVDFHGISFGTTGVGTDTVIHYGNGDMVTLDMSSVLTTPDNALSRFRLVWQGEPAAMPLITESDPTNTLYGTFGADHIIGGNVAVQILPGYGDDIIETSSNNSWVRLNHLYFKDAEGGIGHKEIHLRGEYDKVSTPVHQGVSYHITSPGHFNTISFDWTYPTVNPYDIQLNATTNTALFNTHGEDVLVFENGIEYEDLSFTRIGQDLEITTGVAGGEVRIEQFFVAYDVDPDGQPFTVPAVAANTFIPDLLTRDYVLAAMPGTPIARLRFADNTEYDMATVISDQLVTVPTLPGVTLIGTTRDDALYGGAEDDVIQSREGSDVIDDSGGSNVIDTGTGDDIVTASGNNTVYAGPGHDVVTLTGSEHFVDGGDGNDVITASGNSTVLGGAGNDLIELANGSHEVHAGSGHDQVTISGGQSVINTGVGYDAIALIGGSHVLEFAADTGLDSLGVAAGSHASVVLQVAPGILAGDLVISGFTDEMETYISVALANGTSTLETVIFDPDTFQPLAGSALSEIRFADGTVWSETDILGLAFPAEIAFINGTAGPDRLQGTAGREDIKGFAGNDELRGGAGDDLLTGGSGNDILLGEGGDDQFLVEGFADGYDHIIGGTGFDTLRGGEQYDLIGLSQLGVDDSLELIDGGGGAFNLVSGNGDDNILDFSATELIDILAIIAGSGDDTITGSAGADWILGQLGNDTISGGEGNDRLWGDAGDDVFLVQGYDSGFDQVSGGTGFDTLRGGEQFDLIGLSQLSGSDSLERIDGNGGVFNLVRGDEHDNHLDFSATELIDIVAVIGGAGNDTITGSAASDLIVGQGGDDTLTGGDGNDRLWGDVGDDTLAGSSGDDVLTGSAGSDTYLFDVGGGHDTIRNLDPDPTATDSLQLGGTEHDRLWLTRQEDHLVVDYVGTTDRLTVEDWYLADSAQLERILADDHVLQNNQVDQLVAAMASFDIPTGVDAIIPQDVRAQLEPILTAVWQAA